MGAITNNAATMVFLTISDGKLCKRVQSPTANSKERINKEGKLVHEEFFNGWSGKIIDISTRESDYGKDWMIKVDDGECIAVIQFKYSSGYAASFLKALPNVDLEKEVSISPNLKIEGDKKKTTIFLNQDGKSVKWFYTKETPNGIPSLKKVKIKGVEQWDDSEQMEFLETMVKRKLSDIQDIQDMPF